MPIISTTKARIGFIGNPSDGYFGCTISCAITNFTASVTLEKNSSVVVEPSPVHDPNRFENLEMLCESVSTDGYYGGMRLLLASCKKFWEYCSEKGISLEKKGFRLSYETDIPRQVGLAGSSAIITAAVNALRQHYGITEEALPPPIQANLVWSVEEEELDIRAGLQDRVIQTYGGVVYMDFDRALMESRGYGEYVRLDPDLVPDLFLAYLREPSDSGKIHSDVRTRWLSGDREVVEAMKTFASYAKDARDALETGDKQRIGELMNANFDLRREIFGDAVIGPHNLKIIDIARSLGAPVKFSGSGGAVIGIFDSKEHRNQLERAYVAEGFSFVVLKIDGASKSQVQ